VMDMRDVPVPPYEERYETLENLLNFYFSVRTHSNTRNFLFLDSVLISVDW
jgi:prepilin-type processing-associated H-X9-DG protein